LLLAATLGSAAQAPGVTVAGVVQDQTGGVLAEAAVSDELE